MSDHSQPTLIDVPPQQTRKRRRVKFEFWMDANKPDQSYLGDRLWRLKEQRKFAPTLRKAVRLFFSLMDGDISVLKELFPDIVARIEHEAQADSYEVAQVKHMIQQLSDKIDAAPQPPMPLPTPDIGPQPLSIGSGPKPLAVSTLATPSFDDNDDDLSSLLTVKKSTGNGKQASQNFINSVMNL